MKVSPGVFIVDSETMVADQREWRVEDLSLCTDFTCYAYWLVTDNGVEPEGFDTVEEALESIKN